MRWFGWWAVAGCGPATPAECPADRRCEREDCADCGVVAQLGDISEAECTSCRGAACTSDDPGCAGLPCVDGALAVAACECDGDCGAGLLCGQYTGRHGLCVVADDL